MKQATGRQISLLLKAVVMIVVTAVVVEFCQAQPASAETTQLAESCLMGSAQILKSFTPGLGLGQIALIVAGVVFIMLLPTGSQSGTRR